MAVTRAVSPTVSQVARAVTRSVSPIINRTANRVSNWFRRR
jgi:hypothetical protein